MLVIDIYYEIIKKHGPSKYRSGLHTVFSTCLPYRVTAILIEF